MLYLTFDLELYDPLRNIDNKKKGEFILKQERILKLIFSLINENKLRISCFITNDFVNTFPDFFQEYIINYHEIGCHTTNHNFYDGKDAKIFKSNIQENKEFLEKIYGVKCKGFRAPGGVIPKNLIQILKELSFTYDSSLIPGFVPGRLNNTKAMKKPYYPDFENIYSLSKTNKEIIEFPILTSDHLKLPVGGTFFWIFKNFINLEEYINNYGVIHFHASDFIKFSLKDKSFIWDKIKYTQPYWNFLNTYIKTYKNKDQRLCSINSELLNL